jgi:hypothetical protein
MTQRPEFRDKLVDQAARHLLRGVAARIQADVHEAVAAREEISSIASMIDHTAAGEMIVRRAALAMSDYRGRTMLPREFETAEAYVRAAIKQLFPELLTAIRVGPEHRKGHA